MKVLEISDDLANVLENEAQTQGLSVEDFLLSAIRRKRTLMSRRIIEQEQAWWLNLPLRERARYDGEFVAVHNCQVVDHDKDENALYQRVPKKYPRMPVLIMPAEGPREITVFSPQILQ